MTAQILAPVDLFPAWPFVAAAVILAIVFSVFWYFGPYDE